MDNRKESNNTFIDELSFVPLTSTEQKVLAELGWNKPIIDKLFAKILDRLKNKMLKEDLTVEYVRGCKATVLSFQTFFNNNK